MNIPGVFANYAAWLDHQIEHVWFSHMPSNLIDMPETRSVHDHEIGSGAEYHHESHIGVDCYGLECIWDHHREEIYEGRGR